MATALEAIVVEVSEVSEDIMEGEDLEDIMAEDLEVTEDTERGQLMPNLNLATMEDLEVTEVVSEVLDMEDLEVDLEVMAGTMASDRLPPAAHLSAPVLSIHQANKDVKKLTPLFQIN